MALLYVAVALVWLALSWGEPRSALAFGLGPLLAPVLALGLLPLALAKIVRSPARRFAQAVAAALVAAVAAGLRGSALPFGAGNAPKLGLAEARSPTGVAGVLWRFLTAHPALPLAALALAVAAAAIPYVRGRFQAAAAGAWLVAVPLLVASHAAAVPIVLAGWLTFAVLLRRQRAP